jgi:hypothetical protein
MNGRLVKRKPTPAKDAAPMSNASDTLSHQQPRTPGGTSTDAAPPGSGAYGHLQNVDIVWNLDVDGDECDFPLSMARCKSFSELLEAMQEMALYFPPAATALDDTSLWQLTYTLPSGTKRTQMALKGTEVAFNRMRIDLRQAHLSAGERLDVGIRAIG